MAVRVWALKEWAVAIAALGRGDTIMLLRKGGIHEREFRARDRQVLLYPTQSHQDRSALKAAYAPLADNFHGLTSNDGDPAITDWAQITHCLAPTFPQCLQALYPFHIWTEDFIQQRLAWKPERPLQLLLLRTYKLPEPLTLPERPRGCRSWFEVTLAWIIQDYPKDDAKVSGMIGLRDILPETVCKFCGLAGKEISGPKTGIRSFLLVSLSTIQLRRPQNVFEKI